MPTTDLGRPHDLTRTHLLALRVPDRLVYAQDQTGSLDGTADGVDLDERGFPHKLFHIVGHVFTLDVDPGPEISLSVPHPELVQTVGRVEPGIVTDLTGDDLKRLGHGADDELLLAHDRPRVIPQVSRNLHLGSSTPCDNLAVLDRSLDDHDGIVKRSLDLGDKLFGTSSEQERTRLRRGAVLEHVVPLGTDLLFLELATASQVLFLDIRTRRLDSSTDGLDHSLQVVVCHPSGTKDVPVGKVLSGQVADGETREDDFGAGLDDGVEFPVDDLPLGVDDGLVFLSIAWTCPEMFSRSILGNPPMPPVDTHRNLVDPDLGIVLFRLELEFDVETQDLGVDKALGLLFEPGVGKGLFEGDPSDQERVLRKSDGGGKESDQHAVFGRQASRSSSRNAPAFLLRAPFSHRSVPRSDPPGRDT